ncbi:PTS sugar transporter subunit IIC [Sporolactobacillus shoreicorticis]|uniref:PTS mannose/fructose/sorbose/N-acetylgalactosamine transporter subunit IIC n=1 Tax=Sporolactobacillus shoreicorticis TaxID=1923877 RepID=A0ABW5S0X7_9BACL|nr:PTS sugar transporter subunit IIC [Sporolactobacillus shoreicorticis]MCO7124663.1 PTS sugar transporter subunit IIC [Sporolactobacillus shoreicorticis]
MLLYQAFAVGLSLMFTKFTDWYGTLYLSRPLFCVTVLGFLLGKPVEGITMGAALELVYLGTVSLGGVMPQDYGFGAIFGAGFALILDQKISVGIALSIPLSLLGSLLYAVFKVWITSMVTKFEKYAREKNLAAFKRLWWVQFCTYNLMYFAFGFIAILAGSNAVKALVDAIPTWAQNSLTVAAGMLPALGMALLLKTLWTRDLAAYFFIGFALVIFFKGNLISVAFLSLCFAAIVGFNELKHINKPAPATNMGSADESEGFFDE